MDFFLVDFDSMFILQSFEMLIHHHKDKVSPAYVLRANLFFGFVTGAAGACGQPSVVRVNLLRRRTSPLVHRTGKQNV